MWFVLGVAATNFLMFDDPRENSVIENGMICHPAQECYPEIFEPTAEFQQVKPGQKVPKGLHYEMDWQTGINRAKLLEPVIKSDPDQVQGVESQGEPKLPGESDNTLEISNDMTTIQISSEQESKVLERSSEREPNIHVPIELSKPLSLDEEKSLDQIIQTLLHSNSTQQIQILHLLPDIVDEVDVGAVAAQGPLGQFLLHAVQDHLLGDLASITVSSMCSNNPAAQDAMLNRNAVPILWTVLQKHPSKSKLNALGSLVLSHVDGMKQFLALKPLAGLKHLSKSAIASKIFDFLSDLYNNDLRSQAVSLDWSPSEWCLPVAPQVQAAASALLHQLRVDYPRLCLDEL